MVKYIYPNLCTIYDGRCNGRSFHRDFMQNMCYGISLDFFTRKQNDAYYTIILIKDTKYVENGRNNYCWMSKHQLENYLRRIASIKPFKYNVYEDVFNNSLCYKINLHIIGTKKEVTFVLQCIKRTYEWPYNFYLLQAYEMQKLPAFKFDSILNLFNVAFSAFSDAQNTDHCFSGCAKFEKYEDLRKKLPNITRATQLYPDYVRVKQAVKLDKVSYSGRIPNAIDQWDNKLFNKLLPTYIENYNALKR